MVSLRTLLATRQEVEAVLNHDVRELPCIPVVAVKLLKLTRDDRSSTEDLVKVVKTDPALAAKVLRIINSAAYGLRQKISSLHQAVVLLGFSAIRSLALEVTLFEQLVKPERLRKFDRVFFWRHCLSVASLSMALAEELQHPNPEEVYVAGLLHDIGKIVLDVYGRISYRDFLRKLEQSEGLMVEEERSLLGLGHDDIGAFFCSAWEFPASVVLPIRFHHQRFAHLDLEPSEAQGVAIVSLANFITWIQGIGSVDILRHPILQPEVQDAINLDRINWQGLIDRMDTDVRATADFYDFAFPSSNQFRENLVRANLTLSRMNTRYYYLHDALRQKVHSLTQIKKNLTKPHRSLDSKEIITNTLEAIRQDFGFERVFLMRIDQARRILVTVAVRSAQPQQSSPSGFEIPLTPQAGSFIDCLRQNAPMLITGTTQVEQDVLRQLNLREMGIVPFMNNNHAMGIMAVDNVVSGKAIQTEALQAVAIIANELGMALENARMFEETRSMALVDNLTKLHNRAALDELLARSFHNAKAGKSRLSVAMVDVDFFKKFNDQFGHLAGDSILGLLANTMKRCTRPTDHAGRYGGEEFLVILDGAEGPEAHGFAERLRREVERLGLLLLKRFPGCPLTVSIGVASYQSSMRTKEDLVEQADQALYAAKRSGRNKVVCAGTGLQDIPLRRDVRKCGQGQI